MEKEVLRNFSYGMYVVGAIDGSGREVGCIVNTACQITSQNPTITVSIHHQNYTHQAILETQKFSLSILGEATPNEVIGTFGYQSSREVDKFAGVEKDVFEGLPVLKTSVGYLACRVLSTMETETHTVFLAEVVNARHSQQDVPMTYRYYHDVRKGKSPKAAPTYVEEETGSRKTKWRCSVCGYEVEMDELPEDFRCPICGQPVDVFEKV